ncbi:MAG: hypothetical protein WCS99_16115 [Limisphaerales bacterium]
MNRDDFKKHVEQTLESIIQEAEQRAGRALPRRYCFGFLSPSRVTAEQEQIVEHLTQLVFVDEEHIYPCFDLILGDILDDGRLLFVGYRAHYSPRPWQQNYTGRDGPFVRLFSQQFLDKIEVQNHDTTA